MQTIPVNLRNLAGRRTYFLQDWALILFHLGKMKISLLASLSAAAGYLLATGRVTFHILPPAAAVFLLACGACALNQYQEREMDERMERTKERPLPLRELAPHAVLVISLVWIFAGALLLLLETNPIALSLGLLAEVWYNGIYTPLKQKTAFAVIPGALVGAIPPVLGWMAGGGELFDPRILGIALFFFIWQVPHFLILTLIYSEDYKKSGHPSLIKIFSTGQVKRIVFSWLLCVGTTSLTLPLWGMFDSFLSRLLLWASTSWFFWNAIVFLRSPGNKPLMRTTFLRLNSYVIWVTLFFALESLLKTSFRDLIRLIY